MMRKALITPYELGYIQGRLDALSEDVGPTALDGVHGTTLVAGTLLQTGVDRLELVAGEPEDVPQSNFVRSRIDLVEGKRSGNFPGADGFIFESLPTAPRSQPRSLLRKQRLSQSATLSPDGREKIGGAYRLRFRYVFTIPRRPGARTANDRIFDCP